MFAELLQTDPRYGSVLIDPTDIRIPTIHTADMLSYFHVINLNHFSR